MRQPEPHPTTPPTGQRPGRPAPIIVGLLIIALIPLQSRPAGPASQRGALTCESCTRRNS
jgi:hypothetical protein